MRSRSSVRRRADLNPTVGPCAVSLHGEISAGHRIGDLQGQDVVAGWETLEGRDVTVSHGLDRMLAELNEQTPRVSHLRSAVH